MNEQAKEREAALSRDTNGEPPLGYDIRRYTPEQMAEASAALAEEDRRQREWRVTQAAMMARVYDKGFVDGLVALTAFNDTVQQPHGGDYLVHLAGFMRDRQACPHYMPNRSEVPHDR